ncbi:hypothetical protein AAGG49_22895, partial [Stenotrophomonas maltophilia]|uniref:hypothetical protein n=1 Tax=Stenotrophomonas maltophilia TaxID=40324 RepID=UPI00313AA1D9
GPHGVLRFRMGGLLPAVFYNLGLRLMVVFGLGQRFLRGEIVGGEMHGVGLGQGLLLLLGGTADGRPGALNL